MRRIYNSVFFLLIFPFFPGEIIAEQKRNSIPTKFCTTRKFTIGKCLPVGICYPLIFRSGISRYESEMDTVDSALAEEVLTHSKSSNCSTANEDTESEETVCCALEHKEFYIYRNDSNPIHFFEGSGLEDQCGRQAKERIQQSRSTPGQSALKITGGKEARRGEFPWMVAIFGRNGKHTCGGSLLSPEYVLTAAHCLSIYNSAELGNLTVTIGDYNIKSTKDGPHEQRKIKKVAIHRGFKISTHTNDIALIKLDAPVQFSDYIQPICLPTNDTEVLEGLKTVVTGWGRDRSYGYPAAVLRKVEIPVWSLAKCKRIYRIFAPGRVSDTNICAGDGRRNKDACIGDSGGPLSITQGSKAVQIGIVSWGKGCGSFPGVYTRVDKFIGWIKLHMSTSDWE